jgi:transcriptional regulator of acetoin/glycerol metabolism
MPPETESDEKSSARRAWSPAEPHLFVVLEGERPIAGGMRIALRGADEVLLGRGDASSASRTVEAPARIAVDLADRKVSTRHARLVRDAAGWTLEDAGSTNGSFVNGRRVASERLEDGDVIGVGRTVLRLRLALPTPAGTPDVLVADHARGVMPGLGTLIPSLASELATVARMAASNVPILLLGETGTGKEIMARAIHAASNRAGPFVAINAAALPPTLIEAQLFGHLKGAFSGAARDEIGFVRSAHEGTLFLDEVGDLPRAAQGILLRVLQEGEVVPVGATRPVRVDLRVIAATHQPLEAMIERGDFRADLFARLHGFGHRLWPLRDRSEDVGLLVADLLPRLSPASAERVRFTSDAALTLVRHRWPLNVRELAQALSRALTLSDDGSIEVDHLTSAITLIPRDERPAEDPDRAMRADLEGRLRKHRGNVTTVAKEMNKAPMQIYRWMRKLGLDPKSYR